MTKRWISYTAEQLAWLKANCTLVIGEYHRAFCATFDRTDVSAQNLNGLRKRNGWKTGRTGRFDPGSEPINKGKKCEPGKGGRHPNAQKTQFRKGQLPHNTKFLGHERVNTDGYVEISIDEVNPHTGFERRYVHKHRYVWEQQNGPIPPDHVLKFLDGNKLNTDLSNLELIPRAILPLLNGRFGMAYDQAEPEVRPSILVVAKLKHRVKQMACDQ